jgi:hypothetical protein
MLIYFIHPESQRMMKLREKEIKRKGEIEILDNNHETSMLSAKMHLLGFFQRIQGCLKTLLKTNKNKF